MREWTFLTNHARTLLLVADDPDARLRDIAAALGTTERTAFGIVADLTEAGYVDKQKEGRRNRYVVQTDLALPDALASDPTVGEILEVLLGLAGTGSRRRGRAARRRADA